VLDDGKLIVFRRIPKKTDSGRPIFELERYAEVWYGDINFTVQEHYAALQSDTKVSRRVRIHQDKTICDKFVLEISGMQFDVGRVWHGNVRGIPITDITLSAVVTRYEVKT
jgi:SPP1 family predicted phage head-tail adaptor